MVKIKKSFIALSFIFFATLIHAQEIKKDTIKKNRFNIKFGIDIDTGYYNIKKPQKSIGFGKIKDSTTKDSLVDQILPYERLAKKKYTIIRRAYQNTVSNYNYLFNAKEELNNLLENERNNYQDDPSELISFYDYSLDEISKKSIDSIIYRCNANILLHDLRNNRVDDSYFILAKAYFFHKDFDTAESILQFINQAFFDQKEDNSYLIGSNTNSSKGIANIENERFFENKNVRNETLIWLCRTYNEIGESDKALGLLYLLKNDINLPKRLQNFLNEQFAYTYYKTENYDSCIKYLIGAIPNAIDTKGKARWYYLLGQLHEKNNQAESALIWYKKAIEYSDNPKIIIYSIINQIKLRDSNIENIKSELQTLIKNDKYKPYLSIIYLEVAKLALKISDFENAKKWLISSVKNNPSYDSEKQKALLLLGDLAYKQNDYLLSKQAYDSVLYVTKSISNYENILLRKKYLNKICFNQILLNIEDSLQYFYNNNNFEYENFKIRYKNQLISRSKIFEQLTKEEPIIFANENNSRDNNFYFNNKYAKESGKREFIQKWGTRPNVDNWNRKTTLITNTSNTVNDYVIPELNNNPTIDNISNNQLISEIKIGHQIQSDIEFSNSILLKEQYLFKMAEDFYLLINDYDKASFYFDKILALHKKDSIAEKTLIYLSSIALNNGKIEYRDSLLNIIVSEFPNGLYISRKERSEFKTENLKILNKAYENAFLNLKIGNNKNFKENITINDIKFFNTKYFIPFQFLKVKYLLQTDNNKDAIKLLDSLISNFQSEFIREKCRKLIEIINERKNIEDYLATLNLNNFSSKVYDLKNVKKDSTSILISSDTSKIIFNFNSNEDHYIGLMFKNINTTFVKESINAINIYNREYYKGLKLESSYVQIDDSIYIHWIGPFTNREESHNYLKKINLVIEKELLTFISKSEYTLFEISISDINLINKSLDLDLYLKSKDQ